MKILAWTLSIFFLAVTVASAAVTPERTFARYTEQLQALDAAARLGIYSPAHRQLNRLAIDAEVVYKPCGAGGGDVGAAISDDEARLDRFAAAAANIGITMIPLEKAQHGVQLAR